ncbi:unnamed protein product, partial [Prorocentrum cordatum]
QQLKQLDGAEKRKLAAAKAEHELLTRFSAVARRNQDEKVHDNHRIEIKGQIAIAMGTRLRNLPSEVQRRVSLPVPPLRRWQGAHLLAHCQRDHYFTCAANGDQSDIAHIVGDHSCDGGNARISLHFRSAQFAPTQKEPEKSQQENLKAEHEPRTKLMDEARGGTLKNGAANIAGAEQYHERRYDEPFADIMRHGTTPHRVEQYHGRRYDKPYVDIMRRGVELPRGRHYDEPFADIMRHG